MTEKKHFREQIASHDYRRSRSASEAPASGRRRVVTVPDAEPQMAWNDYAERRNRLYAERSRSQGNTYTKLTSRTFAQTGVRASSGQMRTIKRLPQYQGPAVPVRSGQRNGQNGQRTV